MSARNYRAWLDRISEWFIRATSIVIFLVTAGLFLQIASTALPLFEDPHIAPAQEKSAAATPTQRFAWLPGSQNDEYGVVPAAKLPLVTSELSITRIEDGVVHGFLKAPALPGEPIRLDNDGC